MAISTCSSSSSISFFLAVSLVLARARPRVSSSTLRLRSVFPYECVALAIVELDACAAPFSVKEVLRPEDVRCSGMVAMGLHRRSIVKNSLSHTLRRSLRRILYLAVFATSPSFFFLIGGTAHTAETFSSQHSHLKSGWAVPTLGTRLGQPPPTLRMRVAMRVCTMREKIFTVSAISPAATTAASNAAWAAVSPVARRCFTKLVGAKPSGSAR